MFCIENFEVIISFMCFSISNYFNLYVVGIIATMEKLMNTPYLKQEWLFILKNPKKNRFSKVFALQFFLKENENVGSFWLVVTAFC